MWVYVTVSDVHLVPGDDYPRHVLEGARVALEAPAPAAIGELQRGGHAPWAGPKELACCCRHCW